MPFGDRLGLVGLIVAILGIGITILWPKKVVGWACIAVAILLCGWWGVLEIQGHRHPEIHPDGNSRDSKTLPTITWPVPSPIEYGSSLTKRQLNATASTPGIFVYNPVLGATLPVGTDTLSLTFTPTDTDKYLTATMTVPIVVNPVKATGELQSSIQVLAINMLQGLPNQPPLFINVYYHNAAKLPATELAIVHNVITSDNVIDDSTILLAQDRLLENPGWDAAMLKAKGSELYSDLSRFSLKWRGGVFR